MPGRRVDYWPALEGSAGAARVVPGVRLAVLAPRWAPNCEGAQRRGWRLQRRGLLETGFVAVGLVSLLTRPRSAPGPSEELTDRLEEARRESADAKAKVESASKADVGAQDTLEKAMQQLRDIEAQLKDAEADLEAYPVPAYLQESCRDGTVNICITGASGVGKSSWINAARRVAPRDPDAAGTGVTETTTDPTRYTFPKRVGLVRRGLGRARQAFERVVSGAPSEEEVDARIRAGDRVVLQNCGDALDGQAAEVLAEDAKTCGRWQIRSESGVTLTVGADQVTGVLAECVIWDLPGVGTPRFPQSTYLKDMGIRHFDMVVLMTASRFTEAELMLVEELRQWEVPFFLVRNKVDTDVESEIENEEEGDGQHSRQLDEEHKRRIEAQTIATIKSYFASEFALEDVYCISTRRKLREQYDFNQLELDMERVLRRQREVGTDEPSDGRAIPVGDR